MAKDPKPHGRRTVFPYYKVQRFDEQLMTWRDARKEAFDTLEDAKAFVATLPSTVHFRVAVIDRDGMSILGQETS